MPTLIATTKPGKKYRSLKRPRVYEALRKQGMSKERAAKISNAQAHKAFTLEQLEAFVSSPAYDPDTASLIALGIPALPSLKGEQIAPGITRIHGNLCNVHGRYGRCPGATVFADKPKKGRRGRKPAKPKLTPQQRAAQRDAQHQQNRSTTLSAQGYSPADQAALESLRSGGQPGKVSQDLIDQGVVEQATDGSYRLTSSGRALMNAAGQGDAGKARDTVSGARDRLSARRARQEAARKRQQDAAGKRASAQIDRELSKRERAQAKRQAAAKKPAKAGGGKKKPPTERPINVKPARRRPRTSIPQIGSVSGSSKKPAKPVTPPKQIAPKLQAAAQNLSDGKTLSDEETQALIRNGLARLNKDGELILTGAGMRATQKSFRVFKDATGRHRWIAISSCAFEDRDQEVVSTKALQDDCDYADQTGNYGPLRWWHMPGVDIGDCDFNAMEGRMLIEMGTFRNPAIAAAVHKAAADLEISIGFLHLPTEPDAERVFHHIRRFERSLVPRGKASNRFTQLLVKEPSMIDTKQKEAIDKLGTSPEALAYLQEVLATANAREKAAEAQGVAFKADEPATELPDLVINGVTYKALPPMLAEAKAPMDTAEEDALDGGADDAMEEDTGGLTLSPEDLQAIGSAVAEQIAPAIAQVMGALDLEKKVAGHVQGLMQPYQATKDAEAAERAAQIEQLQAAFKASQDQQAALKAQLDDLLGLQPAQPQRPSESAGTVVNPWIPTDQQLLQSVKQQVPADQQFAFGDLVSNLFGNITPGQA